MKIENVVAQYRRSLNKIDDYFGNVIQGSAEFLNSYWLKNGYEIRFDDKKFSSNWEDEDEGGDEPQYSYEIRNRGNMFWERPEYCLAYVDNGCGQEFYIILDNKKRII